MNIKSRSFKFNCSNATLKLSILVLYDFDPSLKIILHPNDHLSGVNFTLNTKRFEMCPIPIRLLYLCCFIKPRKLGAYNTTTCTTMTSHYLILQVVSDTNQPGKAVYKHDIPIDIAMAGCGQALVPRLHKNDVRSIAWSLFFPSLGSWGPARQVPQLSSYNPSSSIIAHHKDPAIRLQSGGAFEKVKRQLPTFLMT